MTFLFPQVLTNKSFFFLWLSEVFSQIAMNMINFLLIIVVFELTRSNTAVSGVVLAYTIPCILFGIVAGVLVDYWYKKRVLFYTNISRVILLILLAVFHTNISVVFVLAFAISVATQFFIPAETPMIPLLVKKEELFSANAFFGIGVYGSALIAYAISGPLLLLFGQTIIFLLLAGCFAIAAFFIQAIILPPSHVEVFPPKVSLSKGIAQAIMLVIRQKDIFHSLFLLTLSQMLILILGVVGPSYARTILHIGVESFPLLFITPAALGMVVGAFLLIHYFGNVPKIIVANVGVFFSGGVIVLLPFVRGLSQFFSQLFPFSYLPQIASADILHIAIFLAFLLGIANAFVFVPSNTIVQEETDDESRGKVYGVLNTISGLVSVIPVILAGTLTDMFGVFHVLQGIGLIVLGSGILRVVFLDTKEKIG